ncbi:TPA: hypothetical protein PQY61_002640 [Staphylococcus aureus]|nr:hypothetical protein [Staphylococcus aureus]
MFDVEFHVKEIDNIIQYFSKPHTNDNWYKSETKSSLGKLALKLDIVCRQMNSENMEDIKKVIEKVAEANRVIALSNVRSKANKE